QMRRDGFVRRYEINMRKKDGSISPVALSITLLRDEDHKLIGSFCVARDRSEIRKNLGELKMVNDRLQAEIAERTQVEAALQEANSRQQGMLAELEQRNREITLLNQLGDLLQACVTCQEAYAGVAHFMPQLFPATSGALYMLNPGNNLVEVAAAWGETSSQRAFSPEECWALRLGEIHAVHNTIGGLVCRHIAAPWPSGCLCVPLTASGEFQGMLALLNYGGQPDQTCPTEASQRLAAAAAKQISLAISNLRLRETLHAQAVRDPLTGLFNRRYLEGTLEREMARVKRKGSTLAILMFDLDHFKLINDSFGHEAGDAMLAAVGKLLGESVRQEDVPCRYGGEEFALIMPETTAETAHLRAERLRKLIGKLRLHNHSRQSMQVTASVGVATWPEHGATVEEVVRAADAALYQAKRRGRNCVVQAFDPASQSPAKVVELASGKVPKTAPKGKSTAWGCKPPAP
ncbi:MAG: diguanylate cyclase, partial [Deltaproteobacteria bacterium]|nr:diguanylate cyclase [Deltaproteobacteria bacterium]